jgi:MoxR-like ATPase
MNRGHVMTDPAAEIYHAAQAACAHFVDREPVAELIVLAAVAREHLLLVGAPGTAKSAIVRRVARAFGGVYFEYLLGRFTEPSELFGPIDLKRLREGEVITETRGMLPEAEFAFLDEIFLGSTAILNTLLGVLNERRFRRGHSNIECPLRVCVAASNALPEDSSLAAMADRFLLHAFIEPVADHQLEALLSHGRQAQNQIAVATGNVQSLDAMHARAMQVDMQPVRSALAAAIRTLRKAQVQLSDRRIVKAQNLISAAAALAGREVATEADLWPLIYVVPSAEQQAQAREALAEVLKFAQHTLLRHASEQAAQQPLARVPRLLLAAEALDLTKAVQTQAWLRELDANFPPELLPPPLAQWRQRATAALVQN